MQSTRHDANLAALQASAGLPGHVLDVVVLTADAGLLATLREGSGPEHAIWHARSADAAVDLLVGGRCGILIADLGTLRGDAASLLDRLHAQFPELILMVTGRRDEESAVAALVGNGDVYRFLHKPVSPARASLFITAATRRYGELRNVEPLALATVRTIAAGPNLHRIVVALVAVLAAVIAFVIWRSRPEPLPARVGQNEAGAPATAQQVADHLAAAQMAYAMGRLIGPRGDNALEHFRAVLALQPDSTEARTGVDRVVAALEAQVRQALAARNAPQGAVAFTALQHADPQHPRLEELRTQLLSLSRSAGRHLANPEPAAAEKPVKDAAPPTVDGRTPPAVGAASATRHPTQSATTTPEAEAGIAAALPDSPDPRELAAISNLRERGTLIEPAENNAYDRFMALRDRSPDSPAIRAEQQRLAFAFLERTRTALAAAELDDAADFAARADALVPGMETTKALRQRLAQAQEQREFTTNVVSAATLARVREAPVAYPREAERAGIEGWVDVDFTIAPDGTTQDLLVRDAQPKDVFEESAVDSVRRWRFEPVMKNGVAVPQRATLRVQFVLR